VQISLNQTAERYAPSVLHYIRATLRRTYASDKEWGYVESNPARGVRPSAEESHPTQITFEPSQVQKIHEQLKEPRRTMVLVAAVTGMRISELLGLKWSDVDFERRLLCVR
jgi:integrase